MDRKQLKDVLKNYRFFMFNHKVSGKYEICKVLRERTGSDLSCEIEDEEEFMKDLKDSAELLKEYPEKGQILYELVVSSYFSNEAKISQETADLNESTKSKYRWKAIDVMNDILKNKRVV